MSVSSASGSGKSLDGTGGGTPGPSGASALRMADSEKRDLVRALNQLSSSPQHIAARRHPRFELPPGISVLATISQVGGGTTQSVLTVRDVSNAGMAFLHPHYLAVGTRLNLVFVGQDRQPMIRVEAAVKRCAHARGMAHDVGAQFAHEVDLVEMLDLNSIQGKGGAAARVGDAIGATLMVKLEELPPNVQPLVAKLIAAVSTSGDVQRVEHALRTALASL